MNLAVGPPLREGIWEKLSDVAELWLVDSGMAVAKALISCPATGWGVRLTASLLAPEASLPEDKSDELFMLPGSSLSPAGNWGHCGLWHSIFWGLGTLPS